MCSECVLADLSSAEQTACVELSLACLKTHAADKELQKVCCMTLVNLTKGPGVPSICLSVFVLIGVSAQTTVRVW